MRPYLAMPNEILQAGWPRGDLAINVLVDGHVLGKVPGAEKSRHEFVPGSLLGNVSSTLLDRDKKNDLIRSMTAVAINFAHFYRLERRAVQQLETFTNGLNLPLLGRIPQTIETGIPVAPSDYANEFGYTGFVGDGPPSSGDFYEAFKEFTEDARLHEGSDLNGWILAPYLSSFWCRYISPALQRRKTTKVYPMGAT